MDRQISAEALQQANSFIEAGENSGLVLSSPDWLAGIVGISAARVVESCQMPALLLAEEGELARGSGVHRAARS